MKLLLIFIGLNILNVIIQTVKSLATIKCGKTIASVVNAIAYGLYTIVLVYTMCDLSLYTKALVVGLCNLVGVYIVKSIEEKIRKDKLWKVELTVYDAYTEPMAMDLQTKEIPFNYIKNIGKYTIFNCYCATQTESLIVKDIAKRNKAKFFVSESKTL